MKIAVGKYTLRSDRYAMWIDEEVEVQKGKNKGEKRVQRIAGYSSDFKSLLSSFTRHKVVDNDAETVEELLSVLSDIMDDIEEVNRVAFERDFRIIAKK